VRIRARSVAAAERMRLARALFAAQATPAVDAAGHLLSGDEVSARDAQAAAEQPAGRKQSSANETPADALVAMLSSDEAMSDLRRARLARAVLAESLGTAAPAQREVAAAAAARSARRGSAGRGMSPHSSPRRSPERTSRCRAGSPDGGKVPVATRGVAPEATFRLLGSVEAMQARHANRGASAGHAVVQAGQTEPINGHSNLPAFAQAQAKQVRSSIVAPGLEVPDAAPPRAQPAASSALSTPSCRKPAPTQRAPRAGSPDAHLSAAEVALAFEHFQRQQQRAPAHLHAPKAAMCQRDSEAAPLPRGRVATPLKAAAKPTTARAALRPYEPDPRGGPPPAPPPPPPIPARWPRGLCHGGAGALLCAKPGTAPGARRSAVRHGDMVAWLGVRPSAICAADSSRAVTASVLDSSTKRYGHSLQPLAQPGVGNTARASPEVG
jgi:hypothetical protein